MATLCKFDEISIRVFFSRELGVRLHAVHGDDELVVSMLPLRIVQGHASLHIQEKVLAWATAHQREVLAAWRRYESGHRPLQFAV